MIRRSSCGLGNVEQTHGSPASDGLWEMTSPDASVKAESDHNGDGV